MNYVCVAVYLQASPETCQSRIKKRNRHEEQDVPIVSGPLGFYSYAFSVQNNFNYTFKSHYNVLPSSAYYCSA